MCSRMNLRQSAPFSYLEFCIYSPVYDPKSFLIHYAVHIWPKFDAKSYFFVANKAVANSLPHRPPIFSVFIKSLCEAYRRFGTDN